MRTRGEHPDLDSFYVESAPDNPWWWEGEEPDDDEPDDDPSMESVAEGLPLYEGE